LDKLLLEQDDSSAAPTSYTAAIPEYRVVFVKPEDAVNINKSFSLSNGHSVYDIQHPCKYGPVSLLLSHARHVGCGMNYEV
jgi:NADPH-ferrihemoprotein reductase